MASAPTHTQGLPYQGKDPNLIECHLCKSCGKQDESMSRCSRCRCVRYCSRECQRNDFPNHKRLCSKISRMEETVENEAVPLKEYTGWGDGTTDNLFDTEVGNFWGIFETRSYMRARMALANEIHDQLALKMGTAELWEIVAGHYQELLRLCYWDNPGLRFRFPFLLLRLNRDDDAFAFVHFWFGNDSEDESHADRVAASKEGEWVYPIREEYCRFRNLFEEYPDINPRYVQLSTLVAAAVIKMRLVATYEAHKVLMNEFASTNCGKKAAPVEELIAGMVTPKVSQLALQRAQLDRLLDTIHSNNPTMLPALLNPEPLLCQRPPSFDQPGRPTEVYFVLEDAHPVWASIPGAQELLKERFGTNPSYDTDMEGF